MRILVLYFSGGGATKKVAGLMADSIRAKNTHQADLYSVEQKGLFQLSDYDAFVVGTPVYHAAPAKMLMDYFSEEIPLDKSRPALVYSTRGMFGCNTNRILAKQMKRCGLLVTMEREYRSPASDGSLITPFVKRFFEFEPDLERKVAEDCKAFITSLCQNEEKEWQGKMPQFRIGSIINGPNKLAGQLITFHIYLHPSKCTKCGLCIETCPHETMKRTVEGYPLWAKENCENCYRCIHHCPSGALSLSRRRAPKKLLNY